MESEGFNVAQGARESHSHSLEAIDQAYKKSILYLLYSLHSLQKNQHQKFMRVFYLDHM